MKIIHIVPSVADEASGPTYSVTGICKSLSRLNTDVDLCSVTSSTQDISFMNHKESDRHEDIRNSFSDYKFPTSLGPERIKRSPKLFSWLKKECQIQDKVILHNHGMWNFVSLYGSKLNKSSDIQFIQSSRGALSEYSLKSGSRFKPLFWNIYQKRALSRANCFHATSEAEYRDIRSLGFTQPVAVIPNGIDLPDVCPKEKKSKNNTLTYLGRLHPEKGIENLLYSWSSIQDQFKNWKLQIIGPGRKKHVIYYQKKAKELKLDRISFLGPRYGQNKWDAYSNSDLYVLPSPSENFGMTVAESLACGTPVITTNGTPWSQLESKGAGWYIDFGSEALVQGLKNAMSLKPKTLSEMGECGRLWMNEEFSWHQIGKEMLNVYNWLLDQKIDPPKCIRMD